MRAPKHASARLPRPAAAGRAGLFPWVPVCLSLGIGLWFLLTGRIPVIGWVGAAAMALVGIGAIKVAIPLAERGRIGWHLADGMRVCGMALALIAAGMALIAIRSADVAAPVLEWRYYGPVEGRLIEIDRSARDRMRLTLDQVVLRDMASDRTPERVRMSLMNDDDPLPPLGQRIMLTGHLGPPPGPAAPGSFDFRQFAWFDRLGAVGYSRTPVMSVSEAQGIAWTMHRTRMAISRSIQDGIGEQEGAVASALMTGDRSGIEEATNEVMRASNLYHIISISGLHMSMLTGFVYTALRLALVLTQGLGAPLPQGLHKIAALGALLAAAAYLWLSGGGVATERSFVMVAVMLAAILVDRRAISLRTVALAATIILIYSPEALTSPGFQMSFSATVALVLVYGPWSRLSPYLPWWLRPVAILLLSSLVASLATSPIAAAHFNRTAHYGLIANLLAVPVMGALVMPAGVIAALLAPFGLQAPALWVMGIGTKWMLMVAGFIADLGGAVTAIPMPPGPVLPLMGFGAVLMVLTWRDGPRRMRGTALGFGFTLGAAMLALSAVLWLTATRPHLLIAGEGDAVGLMTAEGRAVSKPAGGGFVVENWLLEDGDMATQEESAARSGWSGPRGERTADLPGGWQILHLSGKGASERANTACQPKRIVVIADRTDLPKAPTCLLFDLTRLRQTGAVAIDFSNGEMRITTVME
ncbi:ComEC/Rec2 family competence protein [Paracoccus caeni]|uniref:ComEC/Rec2 family competence protein n=2 Tax=Paracoccus caeni TaxID=657651 RepID=A0A934SJD8_9RHOB|nr:ComEC/Rec2 family competence protein [Paracoccus caeni]